VGCAAEGFPENPWDGDMLNGAVQFGHGPIGPEEIALLGDAAPLAAHFASWE
jgi:hypothetical protein